MEMDTQQARDALRAIAQAESLAARNSKNNGTVPLVWGVVVLCSMIGFDVIPRLAGDMDRGILYAGALLGILPVITALWTFRYQKCLPVQPLKIEKPRLYAYWGAYHMVVIWSGIGIGLWLASRLHLHCLPPFAMTITGAIDAAPLLWVGWDQRRRSLEAGR